MSHFALSEYASQTHYYRCACDRSRKMEEQRQKHEKKTSDTKAEADNETKSTNCSSLNNESQRKFLLAFTLSVAMPRRQTQPHEISNTSWWQNHKP